MQLTSKKIWYKQFWPWFLIVVPLSSMVLSFSMMYLAFNSKDSMVIDDYYKEGRAINLKIQKLNQAETLNIITSVNISTDYVAIKFVTGAPSNGEALILDFFHSTQDFKDFSVTLLKDSQGSYRAPLDNDVAGKWQLSLHPIDEIWKIQKVISLPKTSAFELKP